MSELHKFFFDGLAVRGAIVRVRAPWRDLLSRRAANTETGAYPSAVRALLGEMTAAALLMQSNIKFNGAVVLQIMGDGPVKLAVVEAQANLSFRSTATVLGEVAADAQLADMVNQRNEGRCAITLDPQSKLPGQTPYQGVVPLFGDQRERLARLSQALEHYMLQSEQLDTRLFLAADDEACAGLLIQRLPHSGEKNLGEREDAIGRDEDFNRIAILAGSITPQELLGLDPLETLHRLFWEEKVLRQPPQVPRFACSCSRERVAGMLKSLGAAEVEGILAERGNVEVGCDFCGQQYPFDPVDAAQIFMPGRDVLPPSAVVQ